MNKTKKEMVSKEKGVPSITRQCELLDLPRATFYGKEKQPIDDPDIEKAKVIMLKCHEKEPSYGARRLRFELSREELCFSRFKVGSLMKEYNIKSLSPGPNTSASCPEHYKYPYLLRDLSISRPNQVWCTDITYIRIPGGWVYLVAVLDWYSRRVLSW